MATSKPVTKKASFSRRVVDHVTDELVNVLSTGETLEFKVLFGRVFDGLKLKNAVSGGEEMLRLRCYEKILKLTNSGLVEKIGKSYRGLEGIEAASSTQRLARMDSAIMAAKAKA
ncbi:hypothetical protein [Prosthecobacter vanneervenii]|uniref:Putative membrane GTPase involved in stress response n=1 Tax=Prosthecobacter vanneervenii TaxID=48466 RepID=A0A7W8DMN8_9BACT|nr:hypothetical protein [Prosthecobacter vanneervenii]MBB5035240.1 putative membrane GTPase involved in stress response [Prosthecobacter vanneervenii]